MAELYIKKFYRAQKYRVTLFNPKYDETVKASLMEPLVVNTASSWSGMMDSSAQGGMFDTATQFVFGKSATVGAFTTQKWNGQDEILVNVKIGFLAVDNAKSEVQDQVAKLLQWPLSRNINTLMETPLDVFGGQYITLTNTAFIIKDLLPVSVTPTFSQVKSNTGHPIWANVDLVFKTSKSVTGGTVRGWFR